MKRSKFNLSHTHLTSMDMGELVPIMCKEVYPGDTFQHNTNLLLRCSPLLAPVMHPVRVRIHHYFVPTRTIWEDWEDFITGGEDGLDASVLPLITFPNGGPEVGTLADYLGIPVDIVQASGTPVSALPFRAYAKIWNDCYRDQQLQSELTIDLGSGPDTTTNTTLQRVAWEKDRFTSARLDSQLGASVTIPIAGSAPVLGLGQLNSAGDVFPADGNTYRMADGTTAVWAKGRSFSADLFSLQGGNGSGEGTVGYPWLRADLQSATGIDVILLREALALQRFQENRNRFGSRYSEYLRSMGVRSSDMRLQRPEYLGGGIQTVQFSEVLQTGPGTDPVGDIKGHGIAAMRSNRYRKFFEEHGFVISLLSILPKTMYMQGLPRMWNRRTKEDFWQPEFQHVGMEEVQNKEVYASHSSPDGVWGYQDRYDDLRRGESYVTGEFRTSALNHWHFARDFASEPALNASFVAATPTERVFAVPSEDVLWVMAKHQLRARRLISASGTPFIR